MSPLRLRTVLLALAVGGTALALPASAQPLPDGAVNVVAGPQGSATNYLTTELVATAGTAVSFANLDTTTHDVTSRATRTVIVKKKKKVVPLFATPITPSGGVKEVLGTDGLKAGTYDFYCSLHPGMTGTLTVQ